MKIIVLGENGMLGRYVKAYLSLFFSVKGFSRLDIDAADLNPNFDILRIEENDVVINCIGMIKQRKDVSDNVMIQVNSVFPKLLADYCENKKAKMIHPSTDCCFSGLNGAYSENDAHDAHDVYGKSKSLGEPQNATVIRTSIIGEEVGQSRSLIEWVKSNKGKTVDGYVNHLWNGITCLQFAKVCEKIISKDLFWKGAKHIFSPYPISKYALVKLIAEIWGLGITVMPKETPIKCNRVLISRTGNCFLALPDYEDQLIEMKAFGIVSGS
jgi:dTDP-4-dehydrorhamnose reductase